MIATETLQRIIDGELSRDALAAVLLEVDRHPADWRRVALALLEEQQWSKDFAFLHSQRNSSRNQVAEVVAEEPETAADIQAIPIEADQSQIQGFAAFGKDALELNRSASVEPSKRTLPTFWSALAASLLLAIGFYGGSFLARLQNREAGGNSSLMAHEDQQGTGKGQFGMEVDASMLASHHNPDMKMVMKGPGTGSTEIPIYDFDDVDPAVLWAKENYELAKWNEQLRRRGYELDVKPEYYTGKLNDGRQLIVPVKNVALRPYGL